MDDAIFIPEQDGRYRPTPHASGPWDPRSQHGGAPAALLAHAIEQLDAPAPMQVVRLTLELLRPVPISPIRLETVVLRPGKKVQLVGASIIADETEVARATALRIRVAPQPLLPREDALTVAPPDQGATLELDASAGGFVHSMDIRFVDGRFAAPGPATAWFRLRRPVVAGEDTTPLMRAAAAADFGNGISSVVDRADWIYINPDLTIYLDRYPSGEWVCLQAATVARSSGIGIAESVLHDIDGRIGRSTQSLVIESRAAAGK